jgi:glycosyltransferase involved in cell wall biosynthesis
MARALDQKFDDVYVCDPIMSIQKHAGRIADGVSRRLFKRPIAYDHLALVAKKHGKVATDALQGRSVDAVLAVMNPVDVAYLVTEKPIILVLDSTFALFCDYYPKFTNLWQWSKRQAEDVERMAYEKAASLLYSSKWAAESAIHDYGVDPRKIHVSPYGANLETIPSREAVSVRRASDKCRLLFVGVGWEEKGGTIAVETLIELEKLGVNAELIICGTVPPRGLSHERMVVIPFLNKADQQQNRQLQNLYATSDFLLLPTRREAYGHVFCEASAFGLPCIATNTGGVPEVVRNGENGYVLPYSASGNDYARIIAHVYRDRARYTRLVVSSRAAYERRMNWDVWASSVKRVVEDARRCRQPKKAHA